MENFWDFNVWGLILLFAMLMLFLLIGNILKKSVPFLAVCLFVLGLALISIHPALALFSLCLLYGVSGPLYWCVRWLRRRSRLQQLAAKRAQMHAAREHKTESRTEVNTESPSQSTPIQESEP